MTPTTGSRKSPRQGQWPPAPLLGYQKDNTQPHPQTPLLCTLGARNTRGVSESLNRGSLPRCRVSFAVLPKIYRHIETLTNRSSVHFIYASFYSNFLDQGGKLRCILRLSRCFDSQNGNMTPLATIFLSFKGLQAACTCCKTGRHVKVVLLCRHLLGCASPPWLRVLPRGRTRDGKATAGEAKAVLGDADAVFITTRF